MTALKKWWNDVISSDVATYYSDSSDAKQDAGHGSWRKNRVGSFIWGDRVRRLCTNESAVMVSGRGVEAWVNERHLGGEPLLEVYIIDVGQGDGLLVVTPEGHNIMVDGGNIRKKQNGGKNAADFVDWKFCRDYVTGNSTRNQLNIPIALDAMVATHNDIDHFGGLWDLINKDEKNRKELDASGVTVEAVYHAGLSWWNKDSTKKRTLGVSKNGHYAKLLGDRCSALNATRNLQCPDENTLNGSWGKFINSTTKLNKADNLNHTDIFRISNDTQYLPGFGPLNATKCKFRILGPIETQTEGAPSLKKFPDGDSKNTNGHSIVLRLDYGKRRILLTGDLNTHSQVYIMEHYGDRFTEEFRCDVAKGCHHGSHDVSLRFLDGLRPLCTVISSGDTETYDHPRPNIVAASAITGRRLVDYEEDSLVAPLIYITEVARSVAISNIASMKEYKCAQPTYEGNSRARIVHDELQEMQRFRLFLGSRQNSPLKKPRLDLARVVKGLRYGLINVRTDGKRLFFAQMEESGDDWSFATLSECQISDAR